MGGGGKLQTASVTQKLQAPIQNTTPIPNNAPPVIKAAVDTRSATTTTTHQTKYRALPTKTASSKGVSVAKKRKHSSKETRTIQYFEDSESDNDANKQSGDGSSSGESVHSDAVRIKRQRTSQIATRSSTRNATPDPTPPSTTPGPQSAGASGSPTDADTSGRYAILTGAAGTPAPRPRAIHDTTISSAVASGTGDLIATNSDDPITTDSEYIIVTDTGGATDTDTEGAVGTDTKGAVGTDTEGIVGTDTENIVGTDTENIVGTDTEDPVNPEPKNVGTGTLTAASHPSFPASLDGINEAIVPSFLLRHGTRKRKINIFGYLKSVEDPHFRRVLFHYLRFKIKQTTELNGSLPTTGRPAEISHWTSRARPAGLPDCMKGKKASASFVDSTLAWWASIQPSWRTFERGKVSREVCGGWDVLFAPRVNGLLNVVILVYWWAKILEEDEPEDGVRADYELFADDVAWVLSNLPT